MIAMCSCSPVQVNGDLHHRHQPSNGFYLARQRQDRRYGCGPHVAERVGALTRV